jgi:endo-1,4-beta-xylanase
MKPDADYSTTDAPIFADESQVSGWALENVRYMAKEGFITGVGNNMFNPKGTTTCEQVVIIAVRVYQSLQLKHLGCNKGLGQARDRPGRDR